MIFGKSVIVSPARAGGGKSRAGLAGLVRGALPSPIRLTAQEASEGPAFILGLCDFCYARPLYHCGTGSDGRGTVAERDLTAREDRFIGLCLAAVAVIIVFIFIVTTS
jgi:hypothetical protein